MSEQKSKAKARREPEKAVPRFNSEDEERAF